MSGRHTEYTKPAKQKAVCTLEDSGSQLFLYHTPSVSYTYSKYLDQKTTSGSLRDLQFLRDGKNYFSFFGLFCKEVKASQLCFVSIAQKPF